MENPRPEKVAVVDEVRDRLGAADAVLITEYRGLTVKELASLRSSIRPAGGEYKIYKNTLVRLAATELGLEISDQLTGPTALAIVGTKADGSSGDIAAVAKAIAEFAKAQPLLVTKGGILGDQVLDAAGAKALASLPTAGEVYARLAGALNSGARGLAGSVSGVHRSIALVLQACIDAGAFAGEAPAAPPAEAPAVEEPVVEESVVEESVAEAEVAEADTEAAVAEAPVAEADTEADAAPAAEALNEQALNEQAQNEQAQNEQAQNEQETGETDVEG